MIKFTYAGKEYQLKFYHGEKSVESLKRTGILSPNHRAPTTDDRGAEFIRKCTGVRIIAQSSSDSPKQIAHAIAVCNPVDQFCAATGRKIALQKAIENNRRAIKESASAPLINRHMSLVLWSAYFESCSGEISPTSANKLAEMKRKMRRRARAEKALRNN